MVSSYISSPSSPITFEGCELAQFFKTKLSNKRVLFIKTNLKTVKVSCSISQYLAVTFVPHFLANTVTHFLANTPINSIHIYLLLYLLYFHYIRISLSSYQDFFWNKTLDQRSAANLKNNFVCHILHKSSCFFFLFQLFAQKTLKKHNLTSV